MGDARRARRSLRARGLPASVKNRYRKTGRFYLGMALLGLLLPAACAPNAEMPELQIAARPSDARPGSAIAADLRNLDLTDREARIYAEVAAGNVPTWLADLQSVRVAGDVAGERHEIRFWVTPDYLAVGTDGDFLFTPLSPRTAQRIADLLGASLPTPRMVDLVWEAARPVPPIQIHPSQPLTTVETFEQHQSLLLGQRIQYGAPAGTFVAGHKKDVVISVAGSERPGHVALYGWQRLDGSRLQPLYAGLTDDWVDYSHGIRLVSREVQVDGVQRDLWDVLRDPALAPLLSDEGPIAEPYYR